MIQCANFSTKESHLTYQGCNENSNLRLLITGNQSVRLVYDLNETKTRLNQMTQMKSKLSTYANIFLLKFNRWQ